MKNIRSGIDPNSLQEPAFIMFLNSHMQVIHLACVTRLYNAPCEG